MTDKDKYQWHDLRKDPEDLPEHGKDILAKIAVGNVKTYTTASVEWVETHTVPGNCCAIAWRYIEPFEEG